MATLERRADVKRRLLEEDMHVWLQGGLSRDDGRLALFDQFGEPVQKSVIREAIKAGYAEPWFVNPMRPQWTVCRLTATGRRVATK